MITVTQRLRRGHALPRTVLLVVAVAAATILGLLAMHSLNGHTTGGTHSTVAVADVAAGDHTHHPAATDAGTASGDVMGGCVDCGDHPAGAMTMVCVLGLLVTVLLVARSRPCALGPALDRSPAGPLRSAVALLRAARPPSLHQLCISRT